MFNDSNPDLPAPRPKRRSRFIRAVWTVLVLGSAAAGTGAFYSIWLLANSDTPTKSAALLAALQVVLGILCFTAAFTVCYVGLSNSEAVRFINEADKHNGDEVEELLRQLDALQSKYEQLDAETADYRIDKEAARLRGDHDRAVDRSTHGSHAQPDTPAQPRTGGGGDNFDGGNDLA